MLLRRSDLEGRDRFRAEVFGVELSLYKQDREVLRFLNGRLQWSMPHYLRLLEAAIDHSYSDVLIVILINVTLVGLYFG